jgi:superoxide dismutase, Fe-Mn family
MPARRGLATDATGFEGHQIPALPHDETYAEHGVDGLLSPEGFDLAWTQYQSMMIEKLNIMTMGMPRAALFLI